MFINEFKDWLLEDGRSKETLRSYEATLKDLISWYEETVGDEFDPREISSKDLQDYRSFLETVRKQKPTTVNKKVAALKTYWTFLVETDRVQTDPTRKVKMKSISTLHVAPRWLTRREQSRLIDVMEMEKKDETPSHKWKRLRDLAMAQMMLQAGLRIAEVAALNLDDLDMKHPRDKTVIVRQGKGGKFRPIPMNKDLANALNNWLEVRGESKDGDEAVFLSERKTRITDRGIRKALDKYFRMADIDNASPHCLRHTFAKNVLDLGGEKQLTYVKFLLGHENINTTQRYLTPSEKELRKATESISSER
jgi:integrase/recombinase XerD